MGSPPSTGGTLPQRPPISPQISSIPSALPGCGRPSAPFPIRVDNLVISALYHKRKPFAIQSLSPPKTLRARWRSPTRVGPGAESADKGGRQPLLLPEERHGFLFTGRPYDSPAGGGASPDRTAGSRNPRERRIPVRAHWRSGGDFAHTTDRPPRTRTAVSPKGRIQFLHTLRAPVFAGETRTNSDRKRRIHAHTPETGHRASICSTTFRYFS